MNNPNINFKSTTRYIPLLFVGAVVWTAVAGPNVNEQMFQMDKLVPLTSPTGDADSNMRVVNCDRGQNIAEVLARAEPGDTIRVTGTCVELVSIKTDRIPRCSLAG